MKQLQRDTLLVANRIIDSATEGEPFDADKAVKELEAAGVDVPVTLDRILSTIELMQRRPTMVKFELELDIANAAFKDDPEELIRVFAQGLAKATSTHQERGVLHDIDGNTVGTFKLTMPKGNS